MEETKLYQGLAKQSQEEGVVEYMDKWTGLLQLEEQHVNERNREYVHLDYQLVHPLDSQTT